MSQRETDDVTGTETTGHEWDGIRELDNPLPRWWLWTFYACIIWAVGYMIAYPAIPLINGATPGLLGYSSRAEVAQEILEAKAEQSELIGQISSLSLAEIRANPATFQFAVAGGRAAFQMNCSQCHGSGAAGSPGYPNLNDDVWLWGGALEDIYMTLQHGIRYERDDDTRFSEMPAFGRDGLLESTEIRAVAHYVRNIAGLEHEETLAAAGKPIYEENCAVCHKDDGSGDREQGAPKLNDTIWHYGSEMDEITRQVRNPRHGVMPAWGFRLDEPTLKQLTVYVHSLGGGE